MFGKSLVVPRDSNQAWQESNMFYKKVKTALIVGATVIGSATIVTAGQPGAYYAGNWTNAHPAGGIAQVRVQVQNQGRLFLVHLWGQCTPSPCDWGMTGAKPFGGSVSSSPETDVASLQAAYDQGFAVKQVELRLLDPNTLSVQISTHFKDGSGRQDYTTEDTFLRAQ
jgi:hypothetical protein